MKRLLLLFILSPVILLAQQQAQSVIDSNQDVAINLQSMSASMSNSQCTKVADIVITDNGEYTTVAVFLYDTSAPPPIAIPPAEPDTPVVTTSTEGPPANKTDTATTPPLITETSTPVADIPPVETPPVKTDTATTPPVVAETSIPAADVPPPKDTAAVANKTDTATAPPVIAEIRMPVAEMHLSADGYSLLQKLEGYSPALYNLHDGGYTIGFGFFVPYNEGDKWKKGVTWEGAEEMIQQKVPAYEAQVKAYINVPLTQNEFDALTMLAYNLGGFSKATSIINDVNEQVDIAKLQHDWKKFVHSKAPNVSKGLMKRRSDEIEVRKLSNYQPDRKIQIFKSR